MHHGRGMPTFFYWRNITSFVKYDQLFSPETVGIGSSLLVFVAAAGGGSVTGGFYELFFIFTPTKN